MYTNTPGSNNLLFLRHESKNLLFFRLVRKNESYLFFSFFIKYFFRKFFSCFPRKNRDFQAYLVFFRQLKSSSLQIEPKKIFNFFNFFRGKSDIFRVFSKPVYSTDQELSKMYFKNYSLFLNLFFIFF
jgi:hypothetical protein